jgi:hypothetical protein
LPAANAPEPSERQEPASLDLARLGTFLGIADSSEHEGEALNAIRMAGRLLRAAEMSWQDIADGHRRAELATEAAAVLLAENTALRAELEQLRSTGTAVALWNDVGAQVSDTRRAASWALDLHRRGLVWLSGDFELPFLQRCTTWTGRLTPRMRPIFQRLINRIVAQTGQTPP